MDNTQNQVIQNFRGLFSKYKPSVINNGKQVSLTIDGDTTVINQSQRNLVSRTIRLS